MGVGGDNELAVVSKSSPSWFPLMTPYVVERWTRIVRVVTDANLMT